jgi:uncharacterized repeat protein (TIGR01451 family)
MRTKGGVRVLAKNFAEFSSKYRNWLAGSLVVAIAAIGMQPAQAEGSRNLISSGTGQRAFLDARGPGNAQGQTGGIPRRTFIYAYAEVGETINLGSSAHGFGAGTIRITRPDGSAVPDCPAPTGANGLAGRIQTLAQELAGPAPNAGGYTPCVVTADQAGIWRIEFTSPAPNDTTDPPPLLVTAPWTQAANRSWIAAWDVTVRSSIGQEQFGRAFADYLPLNIGRNISPALFSTVFFQTRDGYLYSFNTNGLDPFGFIFFANNKGFVDANGARYRSFPLGGGTAPINPVPPVVNNISDPENVTHKLFFNQPSTLLPPSAPVSPPTGGSIVTWLLPPVEPPPTLTNFSFVGAQGTTGQGGTAPNPPLPPNFSIGNFRFDAPSNFFGSAVLKIDINRDNVYGNANDRIIFFSVRPGTNLVPWDGLDGNGNPVPASNTPYSTAFALNSGEVHFPFLDPENNPIGFIVQRRTPLTVPPDPLFPDDPQRVYYNDSGLTGGTPPNPVNALGGISSANGAHGFSGGFGDVKGIDTWVLVPSRLVVQGNAALIAEADLSITKAIDPTPVVPGNTLTYTLVVNNAGISNVTAATVTDTVPAAVTNVSWTCAVTTGVGSCGSASGTGNAINTTVNLNAGASATYTITGTVALNATGTLDNVANIAPPPDVTDPNQGNNQAQTSTPIAPAGPLLGVAKQVSTPIDNGDGTFNVTYTVTATNLGTVLLENLQLTDNLATAYQSAVSFSVVGAPNSSTLTGNPGFTGNAPNINLLAGTDQLPVGASATVTYSVRVNPGTNLGPYNNTVRGNATGGGTPVSDDSTVGVNPDPNNDGLPDERVPTPVNFGQEPNLVLVKRITAATRAGTPLTFSNFVDDPSDTNDTLPGWSQLSPVGVPTLDATNPLNSGDEVEYTIYFLSDGSTPALDVNLCDLISPGSTFVANTNQVRVANSSPTAGGVFFSPLSPLPAGNSCTEQTNQNGALIFNLGTVSNTAGSNFGFVRFRVRVD